MVVNPILRGMNPDPSICTDGKKYYIATSTFEWFPGLKIYESEDLANWSIVARPLKKQINLLGVPDSAGVWAPGLNYFNHKFWLTYSVMHQIDGNYKDLRNYLVSADEVSGEWSKPIYIGSQGFDPSIFQDDDGKTYILSQNWDYRRTYTHQAFNGIIIQEFDIKTQTIKGFTRQIFKGSAQGGSEGPTLYKRNGYYYLLMAEGGSGRHHSITVARSKSLNDEFELSPEVTLITAYNAENQPLQKAGHGNLVETSDGKTYLVHLVSRYLPGTQKSVLGRETAIEPIIWKDDWPMIKNGNHPSENIEQLPKNQSSIAYRTNFENGLDLNWSTLRHQVDFEFNKGIVIPGDESLSSTFQQSLVARSWPDFSFNVRTKLQFNPRSFRNQAGVTLYYNTHNWIFLYESFDEMSQRRILNLQMSKAGKVSEPANGLYIYLPDGDVELGFDIEAAQVKALYKNEVGVWQEYGRTIDASFMSDEGVDGWGFTGSTVGLTCIDTDLKNTKATFSYFSIGGNENGSEKMG
ncbi:MULTISPECIES: glycoside hydrolase family 43 protein [unclassified Companilactobacillus]|uniref:glycoside hydrolase family 43 protein n=1 Tax=unclassified Companilactobacillus TaxID=2767904 RepID=UPI002FF178FF